MIDQQRMLHVVNLLDIIQPHTYIWASPKIKRDRVKLNRKFKHFLFKLQVFEHKEARSGKVCQVRMSATLLGDIHIYARHVSKPDTDETYLFLTVKGRFITPSKYLSYILYIM
jgi:hypothetical protein